MTQNGELQFSHGALPPVHWCVDFVSASELSMFTGTAESAGTGAMLAGGSGGRIVLSGAATTDDSGYQIQAVNGGVIPRVNSVLRVDQGYKLGVNLVEWWLGLGTVDTTILASLPTDAIYLTKAAGANGAVTLNVRAAGASVAAKTIVGLTANTADHRIGFAVEYTGGTGCTVTVYYDGNPIDILTVAAGAPMVYLAPAIAMRSGSAVGTQLMEVDRFAVLLTR